MQMTGLLLGQSYKNPYLLKKKQNSLSCAVENMAKVVKNRSRNFTEFEKHLLFDIISSKYLNMIDNKKNRCS